MNLASFILGLVSWIIPAVAIARRKNVPLGPGMVCCAVALLLQLMEVRNRVNLNDWAALMDTIGAVVFAALVMLGICLILHAVAFFRSRKK